MPISIKPAPKPDAVSIPAAMKAFNSVELAKRGFKHVIGVDARERSLQKARFVTRALGLTNTEFLLLNAEEVSPSLVGHAQITLFLGLLYHLDNPMLCLRRMSSVTDGLCILETLVIDEVEARRKAEDGEP